MTSLILASTSRYRRSLLERLNLPFRTMSPNVDERAFDHPPRELAKVLSRAKAEAAAQDVDEGLVIGSDQVACLQGEILHKPGTEERAVAQLMRLAGHEHELITGVCIVNARTGAYREHLDIHRLRLRALTESEALEYVRRDQPLDCAGSYKIEGLGISLMDRIQGDDFTAITGLPLMAVCRMLGELGLPILGATS